MSDFYEGRMIPLKIADMAIISCNKEIEKLQIENARLKAEVERLTEAWVDKKMQQDRDFLLQQVERLTKAGDAMQTAAKIALQWGTTQSQVRLSDACTDWNAAREVQS